MRIVAALGGNAPPGGQAGTFLIRWIPGVYRSRSWT